MRSLHGVGGPLAKFALFAAVTLLCTALLAGTIANRLGGDSTSYSARFTDATGVNAGDEIRIAGVRVGQVDDIRLVDRKIAVVDFSVRANVPLPRSVQVTIKYRNLIGQRFIALEQGVGAPERLPEGATIPVEQTHPALNLTQLFNGFRPLFQALSPQDVNQLSFELVKVLQGEGGTVTSLLAHTATLTSAIADKDAVIGSVVDNLNQVLDTVNARDEEFTQLVITVRQLVSGLSGDRRTIGEAVDSFGELTRATADLLKDARPPLKNDIEHLGDLAGNLNDNQELVDRFLVTLPKKLDVLLPLGTTASNFRLHLCDISGTVSGTISVPGLPPTVVPDAPLSALLPPGLPVGPAQPRCTADGLPNDFGTHDDHGQHEDSGLPLTIPTPGGGG
jgi:phospholipid/cholesterol/gamma-HCH transport system substrate-binding protein